MGKSKQYRQAFLELKETYESRIQKIEFGSGSEDGNGPPSSPSSSSSIIDNENLNQQEANRMKRAAYGMVELLKLNLESDDIYSASREGIALLQEMDAYFC